VICLLAINHAVDAQSIFNVPNPTYVPDSDFNRMGGSGLAVPAHPNFSVAAVRAPDGTIHTYFSHNWGDTPRFTYNAWLDTNGDGLPDTWSLSKNVTVLDETRSDPNKGLTVALGSVLRGSDLVPGLRYTDPATGIQYPIVMYFVAQRHEDINPPSLIIAGHLCYSFSSDGLHWTHPMTAVWAGSSQQPKDCNEQRGDILVEEVSAFHTNDSTLHLITVEGDINALISRGFGGRTNTFHLTASPSAPHRMSFLGELSPANVQDFKPASPSFDNYHPFVNLDAGFESVTHSVYMLRSYPYPFDEAQQLPCSVNGPFYATWPNRGQVYWMWGGSSGTNIDRITNWSNPWTLDYDLGRSVGWTAPQYWCGGTPLSTAKPDAFGRGQRVVGHDIDYMNVVKTTAGHLWDTRAGSTVLSYLFLYAGYDNRELSDAVDLYWGEMTSAR